MTESNDCESLCAKCIYYLHYQYDREVDTTCKKGHEARLYPPITECDDCLHLKMKVSDFVELTDYDDNMDKFDGDPTKL